MVFVEQSIGAVAVGGKVTTIFGVTCKGYLTVQKGTTTYVWKATEDGNTKAEPGEPSKNGIVLLPAEGRTPDPDGVPAPTPTAVRRRGYYGMGQEGGAPRCPNTPREVWPRIRAGARGENPNGCGPANGIDLVPDWNFGGCCNNHDNCFDNCNDKTFERCNVEFQWCMHDACRRDYSSWYNSWVR
jgi:hypothetical protein